MGAHGVLGNEPDSIDYSVHEAWNEATNVYLLVILVSFGLLMYARKNKRKIMRIFTLPPTAGSSPEPNFYDSLQKVRLRQQLEMYSLDSRTHSTPRRDTPCFQLTSLWESPCCCKNTILRRPHCYL
ncbi:small integral membrane protein 19 isoform X1 [Maylandia zebra]|uniref:Small integral membrane protein 19 n=1 Tax=Astatotilapia calliptera TaxID=8154 RepID=A0AAX7UUQ0_ASTCA|nr:small integral membrane protein 19 isoform X1 [Haplochromis burtoni]XP_026042526.1 small integral membrane protein 19 isoform X2 [Astatotilapia calliptera]